MSDDEIKKLKDENESLRRRVRELEEKIRQVHALTGPRLPTLDETLEAIKDYWP